MLKLSFQSATMNRVEVLISCLGLKAHDIYFSFAAIKK